LYVRLITRQATNVFNDYTYTAFRSPGPVISSLSPASAPALSAFNLTIGGFNFVSGAVVVWNNSGQLSELVPSATAATSLTVSVPAALLSNPATIQISVKSPNGTVSNPSALSITAPPLVVSGISQISAVSGSPELQLSITGSGFLGPAAVSWNGQPLPTTVVNPNLIRATVSAALLSSPGTASIVLTSAGRTSAPLQFTIQSYTPPIYSNALLTKSAPPEAPCARPAASNSFLTSDTSVHLYFEALVLPTHRLTSDWVAPDGTVIPGGSWGPKEGFSCYTAALPLANLPANRLGTWQARAYENGIRLFSLPFTVAAADPTLPAISPGEVRNGAGFQRTIASGTWVQIKGVNLSAATRTWRAEEIIDGRLPRVLDGVSVTIGGQPASVYYISAEQINALAPANLDAGPAEVIVTNNGKSSAPVMVTVEPFSPAFFTYGSDGSSPLPRTTGPSATRIWCRERSRPDQVT
jgi:hypothetical protein